LDTFTKKSYQVESYEVGKNVEDAGLNVKSFSLMRQMDEWTRWPELGLGLEDGT
jgi:hypothetical protein